MMEFRSTMLNDLLCVNACEREECNDVTTLTLTAPKHISLFHFFYCESITNRNDDYKNESVTARASHRDVTCASAGNITHAAKGTQQQTMEVDLLAVLIFFSPSLNQKLIASTELRPLITRFGPTILGNFRRKIKNKKPYFLIDSRALQSRLFMFLVRVCLCVCVCDYQSEIMTSIIK